jgi:hypothetical protein
MNKLEILKLTIPPFASLYYRSKLQGITPISETDLLGFKQASTRK